MPGEGREEPVEKCLKTFAEMAEERDDYEKLCVLVDECLQLGQEDVTDDKSWTTGDAELRSVRSVDLELEEPGPACTQLDRRSRPRSDSSNSVSSDYDSD